MRATFTGHRVPLGRVDQKLGQSWHSIAKELPAHSVDFLNKPPHREVSVHIIPQQISGCLSCDWHDETSVAELANGSLSKQHLYGNWEVGTGYMDAKNTAMPTKTPTKCF